MQTASDKTISSILNWFTYDSKNIIINSVQAT